MKHCLLFFMFCALILFLRLNAQPSPKGPFPFSETTAQALIEVEKAAEQNRLANYEVVFEKPNWPEFGNLSQARYYHRYEQDGTMLLQLELYDKSGLAWLFVQNRDGIFGHCKRFGWTLRMHDSLHLFQLEALTNTVQHFNMRILNVTKDSIQVNGHGMTRYRFQVPENVEKEYPVWALMRCYAYSHETEKFKKEHAWVWEYLVDESTGLLMQRRTMNANGKLVSLLTLGDFRLVEDWSSEGVTFETPDNVIGEVLTEEGFLLAYKKYCSQASTQQALQKSETLRRKSIPWHEKLIAFLTGTWGVRMLLAVGVACLLGGYYLRKRSC